jgi:hypothetical protein
MRKTAWGTLAALFVVFSFSTAVADEKKEETVTKKGTIGCAKCAFGKITGAKGCAIGILVKEKVDDKEKEVFYYFDAATHKKWHGADAEEQNLCTKKVPGTVKGVVTKDGDKLIIKCSDVKLDK